MRAFLQTFILLGLFTLASGILNAQWIQTNGTKGEFIRCFAVSGTNLFAGTNGDGLFLSTDNGTSWSAVNSGLTNNFVWALATSGTNLFAGTQGDGVFLSPNNGTSWSTVDSGLPNIASDVFALVTSGTNLFAGTYGDGVFLSTNNGTSWSAVNSGLTNTSVFALATSGTNLFAGTQGDGVWRRPLSEFVTSVEETGLQLPEIYALAQNYPNPFNPSTTIHYQIPNAGHVMLKVYDMLGREVATLVNQEQEQGRYSAAFDASRLASGVYITRLTAGDYTKTLKMVLMK